MLSSAALMLSVASLGVSVFSFRVNRDNNQISQRAYLAVDTPKASYEKAGQLDELEAVIRNLGNTPARNVEISYTFTDAEDGKGKRIQIRDSTQAGDIGPKDEFSDPESFDRAVVPFTRNKPFSYITKVSYLDVFQKRHWLQICWTVDKDDVGQCEQPAAGDQ